MLPFRILLILSALSSHIVLLLLPDVPDFSTLLCGATVGSSYQIRVCGSQPAPPTAIRWDEWDWLGTAWQGMA